MPHIPTKRCTNLEKHEPHPWMESKHFRRECPGRTNTKLRSRSRREGHHRRQ